MTSRSLYTFVALVVALGAGAFAGGMASWNHEDVLFLVSLAVLVAASEVFDFGPFSGSRISLSMGAVLAAGTFSGLPGAVLMALVTACADFAAHRKDIIKAGFNFGAIALAGAAHVGVIEIFSTGASDWTSMIGSVILGSVVAFAVNSALVAFVISLSSGEDAFGIWNANFRWVMPYYVLVGVLGLTLAAAYDRWELGGMAMLLVPLAMVWLAVREHMAHPARRPAQSS